MSSELDQLIEELESQEKKNEAQELIAFLGQMCQQINGVRMLTILGKAIRKKRKEIKKTREEFANYLGVQKSWVIALECGLVREQDLNPKMLKKIGECLNISLFSLHLLADIDTEESQTYYEELMQFLESQLDKDGSDFLLYNDENGNSLIEKFPSSKRSDVRKKHPRNHDIAPITPATST